jgi:hypothetical protein
VEAAPTADRVCTREYEGDERERCGRWGGGDVEQEWRENPISAACCRMYPSSVEASAASSSAVDAQNAEARLKRWRE